MTPSPGSLNQANAHTQGGAARTRGDMLRLTVNGVEVGPPVPQHRPAYQQQHPGRRHRRLTLTPALRNPVIRPSHRCIKLEVNMSSLHHRPPEPP